MLLLWRGTPFCPLRARARGSGSRGLESWRLRGEKLEEEEGQNRERLSVGGGPSASASGPPRSGGSSSETSESLSRLLSEEGEMGERRGRGGREEGERRETGGGEEGGRRGRGGREEGEEGERRGRGGRRRETGR